MEVSYIPQINILNSKSVQNKSEMNGRNKSRAVFSNISNTVSAVDTLTHVRYGKSSEESAIYKSYIKSKELCDQQLENDDSIKEHDTELEELFFSNEVRDDYNDILPKSIQLSEETIHNLMGFTDSYKDHSITFEAADLTFLPDPSFYWGKEAQGHIDFILEKDFEDVPFP